MAPRIPEVDSRVLGLTLCINQLDLNVQHRASIFALIYIADIPYSRCQFDIQLKNA